MDAMKPVPSSSIFYNNFKLLAEIKLGVKLNGEPAE